MAGLPQFYPRCWCQIPVEQWPQKPLGEQHGVQVVKPPYLNQEMVTTA